MLTDDEANDALHALEGDYIGDIVRWESGIELSIDGYFSLAELRAIVAILEQVKPAARP